MLKVEYGTIYSNEIGIDNPSVVIDSEIGLVKFGDIKGIKEFYEKRLVQLKQANWDNHNLFLIEFDKYDSELNIEQICEIINKMKSNSDYALTFLKNMLEMSNPEIL